MSSAHNRNSVLQQFDHGNAVEIYTQWNNVPFLLGTATYVYLPKNKLHFWSSGATVKHGRAVFVTKPWYSSRNGFQGLVDFVQYLKWVLGPINNDHTSPLSSYLVAGGLPQLLGGFGGGVSASPVSVPRVGMGGGAPLSAGNRLSGISVMLTVMGRTPVV